MGSRSDKKRAKTRRPQRRKAEPPPDVIPHRARFYPRGGYSSRPGYEWVTFRRHLGLSDTRHLAKLLGVTIRSIQRWEYHGPAPRWYHAALLGLRDVWGTVPGEGLRS